MGRVHVLAVLKIVRADLVRVVQLLCSFRAKITWPSDKRGGGVNIVLIICQPNHFNEYLLRSLKYFVREKHNKNMIFKIVSEKHLIKC